MKKLIIITCIFASCSCLYSQNSVDNVLAEIEKNNTSLAAFRKTTEAVKIGNKTGIYLPDPEAGFNYLWGSSTIGNRTDINLTQSFDFPSAYVHKNQIAGLRNDQAELEYQKQLRNVRLSARMLCADLIYTNALRHEYSIRLEHARRIAVSYQSKFDTGETNILELNKSKLNLLNSERGLESIEISRNNLLSELSNLNGGQFIGFTDSIFTAQAVPDDFDQWFASVEKNNPDLSWLKKEMEISGRQVSLNHALNMPKFQAGYMSELIPGEEFRGITAGISIPLWENRNKVKFARANASAAESIINDNKIRFYNRLKALHAKVIASGKNVAEYRSGLISADNSELVRKALDYGEVSLLDYMFELSIYYDSINRLLELERDLNKSVAELNQYN